MKRVLFMTGATGFLGQSLLKELSQLNDWKIYALTRDRHRSPEVEGIHWVEGDLRNPDLVNDESLRQTLHEQVTDILHGGALYDLSALKRDLYLANVVGTHHTVAFGNRCRSLRNFHHVSTMAVSGSFRGIYTEENFDEGQTFPDAYGETKFLAESCVRQWRTPVNRIVHRLGVLVGDSKTGSIAKIDGPYYVLRALFRGRPALGKLRVLPFPFSEETRLYLVAVDLVSRAITLCLKGGKEETVEELRTYHLMGQKNGISVPEFMKLAFDYLGIGPRLLPLPRMGVLKPTMNLLNIPTETLAYMYSPCQYATEGISKEMPEIEFPDLSTYSRQLFDYAATSLFGGDR